ncbi:hypothetical protein HMPREF0541_02707 [Lacticaseibacillus rhamnosus ATCC 21052]|nr:hypothetical protein HMPREF0541_02707 [Lacticaseibacillus rhamnosus ATCC 21052]
MQADWFTHNTNWWRPISVRGIGFFENGQTTDRSVLTACTKNCCSTDDFPW